MKKHWIIAPFVLLGAVPLAFFIWSRFSATHYHGKSAKYWAYRYTSSNLGSDQEALAALKKLGPNAVPALAYIATATNASRYDRAVLAVAARLPRRVVARLNLPPPPPYPLPIRMCAMSALGTIGPAAQAAIPALTRSLTDREDVIPSAATFALGRLGKDSVPVLLGHLHDTNTHERREVAYALGLVGAGGRTAMPDLFALQNHDPLRYVSDAASNSLAEIADAAPTQVVDMLFSEDPREREVAAYLCGARLIPDHRLIPRLMELSQAPETGIRRQALWSLARIVVFHPEAVPALSHATQDSDSELRLLAINGLGRAAKRGAAATAVPALIECLKQADPKTRESACRTLADIGPGARPALPALRALSGDPAESVRGAAGSAVKAIEIAGRQ